MLARGRFKFGKKRKRKQRGIILLEALLALTILGFLLGALIPLFWFVRLTISHQQDAAEVQYTVCQARYYLLNDLRHSRNVYIKDSRNGSFAEEGNWVLLEIDEDTVDYYVHNNQLYRDSCDAPPMPVAEHIEDFYCRHSGPGLVTVRFTAVSGQCSMDITTSCCYGFY